MSEEKKKWDCDCQKYLENQLKNLKPWQVNAKQKIEELIANKECPYKKLDRRDNKNFRCDLPNKNIETNLTRGYQICDECGGSFLVNWQWIDKTGEYHTIDYCRLEDHLKECEADTQIKSNQIKSNQIKSNQIKSNQINCQVGDENLGSKPNYLPWILGGIGLVSLIGIGIYFLTKRNKESK